MADIISNVTGVRILTTTSKVAPITFGATVVAPQPVYRDTDDGLYRAARNNGDSTQADVRGITLNGGTSGQKGVMVTAGEMDLGAPLASGMAYVLSVTGICPVADLGSGRYISHLGYATVPNRFILGIKNHEERVGDT